MEREGGLRGRRGRREARRGEGGGQEGKGERGRDYLLARTDGIGGGGGGSAVQLPVAGQLRQQLFVCV